MLLNTRIVSANNRAYAVKRLDALLYSEFDLEMHSNSSADKPLVLLGHPGHELRIYGWLKKTQPEVWVITDGSGAISEPRIGLSKDVLQSLGLTPGSLFGAYTDREIYTLVLKGELDFFVKMAMQVASHLISGGHNFIVSDASEGYNPTHDLCCLIAQSAAQKASRDSGRFIPHYTFPLTGHPDGDTTQHAPADITVTLDEEMGGAKIQAALNYAQSVDGTLLKEVQETVERFGTEIFKNERLLSNTAVDYENQFSSQVPFYEQHGERRMANGSYTEVIKFRKHMLPIAKALYTFAAGENLPIDADLDHQ